MDEEEKFTLSLHPYCTPSFNMDQEEDDVEYIHACHMCSKVIDFSQFPVPDADDIIMFNYHEPRDSVEMPIKNMVVMLCSKRCKEQYRMEVCDCVVCGNLCIVDKWYVHMKFFKMGGWTSIKAACSQQCHKYVLDNETADVDLRYCCWYCKKLSATKIKKCGNCHLALYCNGECQRNHWRIHKLDCK
jgi:hypothetical protein